MSSGNAVEIPFGYTREESNPSGSKKIWCDFLSENLYTLSSIEGQYLGPEQVILPLYTGDKLIDFSIRLCVSSVVLVIEQSICF